MLIRCIVCLRPSIRSAWCRRVLLPARPDTPARHSSLSECLLCLAVVVRPQYRRGLSIGRLTLRSDRRQIATAIGLVLCVLALAASP